MAWGKGDSSVLERLVPLVDAELRRIARSYLDRELSDPDLQTTAIINETYLRLLGGGAVSCNDRTHFFAVCAQIMRRILVDHARTRRAIKRGGGAEHVPLDETRLAAPDQFTDVIAIDQALDLLSHDDARKAKVVELRFFGGLSVEETARVLDISNESVIRDWKLAKIWLWRQLGGERQEDVFLSE